MCLRTHCILCLRHKSKHRFLHLRIFCTEASCSISSVLVFFARSVTSCPSMLLSHSSRFRVGFLCHEALLFILGAGHNTQSITKAQRNYSTASLSNRQQAQKRKML